MFDYLLTSVMSYSKSLIRKCSALNAALKLSRVLTMSFFSLTLSGRNVWILSVQQQSIDFCLPLSHIQLGSLISGTIFAKNVKTGAKL